MVWIVRRGDLGQTAFSEATCRDVAKVHRSDGLDLGVLLGALGWEVWKF